MNRIASYVKKNIMITIIATAVIVPGAIYAISPYFTGTTIDEPSPAIQSGEEEIPWDLMEYLRDEDNDTMTEELSGRFQSAGDGIHNASGKATVLYLEDETAVLRFENFRVTNGPDLYVYLATDKNASNYVELGKLKANSGNQNYELPADIDLSKYNNVIIWCKAFGVYFGGAEIASV